MDSSNGTGTDLNQEIKSCVFVADCAGGRFPVTRIAASSNYPTHDVVTYITESKQIDEATYKDNTIYHLYSSRGRIKNP